MASTDLKNMDLTSENNEALGAINQREEELEKDHPEEQVDHDDSDHGTYEPSPKRLKMELTPSPGKHEEVSNEEGIVISLASPSPSRVSEEEIQTLKASIQLKEEELRKLELVQFYKNKWSKDELKGVIDQWKLVAAASFEDLYAKTVESNPDLTREGLLKHLHVDPKLIDLELE